MTEADALLFVVDEQELEQEHHEFEE